jgi:murein DD-endopeptidase MepM/ murein hydrolase activator NlpD
VAAIRRETARFAIAILATGLMLRLCQGFGGLAAASAEAVGSASAAVAQGGQKVTPTGSLNLTASSPSARPGDVVVLTIGGAGTDADVRVRAFNRDLPTFAAPAGKRRALVGVDLEVRPGTYTLTAAAGDRRTSYTLRVVRRAFATRRLTVDPAFVNPPESELPRIDRERKQLERFWETWTPDKLWEGAFEAPVPVAANSAFGTRSILNGEPRSPHGGADFPSPAGTPIKAPNSGRVVLADPLYYSGNTVVVDHGLGLYSLFAHMTEMHVHVGDAVKIGDVLGTVGSTGRVTGPHLHWAVRLNTARVDPLALIRLVDRTP